MVFFESASSQLFTVAGDLLRAEQIREGSQFGELIRTCIREGTIVPMEITVKLLENAMRAELEKNNDSEAWTDGRGRFLIDGFPRKMDQAIKFEEDVRYVLLSFDYRLYPESRCRCASRLSYYSSRQRRK